ncbi:MAG: dihydrofolate reductase [Lachnospiraceae bacterium]|nr:dihydrofolate reductase [Lachnospiraceae bacterium]MBR4173835.1 dihydrofolate reductase [Lachnospiraceae bacterium]
MKMIAAVDNNWAIGYKNKLLVRIPADQKYFRNETIGKVIVMGRKTLESFPQGQPLAGRTNVVLSRKPDYKVKGTVVINTVEETLDYLSQFNTDDIFIIGGEIIYRQFLDYCDEALITKIDHDYQADAWFPNLDELKEWQLVGDTEEQTYFDLEYRFLKYKRV